MNLLGVKMKCETRVVRRTWEMVIRDGVTIERLRGYLNQIPDDAKIVSIEDHETGDRTVIEFERETIEGEPTLMVSDNSLLPKQQCQI